MPEWFSDEDFWTGLYPAMFSEERIAIADEEISQLMAMLEFNGTEVLDLCCGPGRHSVALARRGLRVTGVDRSPFLLGKARERAIAEGTKVEWIRSDMREFRRENAFDLAINLFTSFGYFEDPGEDLVVLRNLRESLRPGGILVMDIMGKEVLARIYRDTLSRELPDGGILLQRTQVTDDWTRVSSVWTIIQDGRAKDHTFVHRIYSAAELKSRFIEAGFTSVRAYGDFLKSPYGTSANRLVLVAGR